MNEFGINMSFDENSGTFVYQDGAFGPTGEQRRKQDIKHILANPSCSGPDVLYTIAMDVGQEEDISQMRERNLLFGVVHYAKGFLGDELIRSQGHQHAISPSCNDSTCELYEIWNGEAFVYMQDPNSNMCYGVHANVGDKVIVPPHWVHATMNADPNTSMEFGAWCVRDYGFDYREVHVKHGIAFYPQIINNRIEWEQNPNEKNKILKIVEASELVKFNIANDVPIYRQFQTDPDKFLFVAKPHLAAKLWQEFKL